MSKIATYSLADSPLQLSDRLIGTEAPRPTPSSTPLATKNFSLGELLQLFSSNFPAPGLQAVLDTDNTAAQDINLAGTIYSTAIKPVDIIDMLNSVGTPLQVLSKGVGGICWIDFAGGSAIWGSITGTITNQVDLISYLGSNFYPLSSNPAGYLTSVDLSGYATELWVGSNYYPLSSNPAGYITQDNVEEYPDFASFPPTGVIGTIYIALDTGLFYSWNGSSYVLSSPPNTGITGVGITNRVPLFTSPTTLGVSAIEQLTGVVYINRINTPSIGNTTLSVQRASGQSQIDFSLGNPGIAQDSIIQSTNTLGLTINSRGYMSFGVGNTYSESLRLLGTGQIQITQTPDTGTTSDFILLRDSLGNLKQISYPTLGDYVPYTGATQGVDLGVYGLTSEFLQLNTTPTTYTPAVGRLGWNDTDGTLEFQLKGGNVTLQIGQEQVVRVVNKTVPSINLLEANYQVCLIAGATGQRVSVRLAQADNDANSAGTLGVVTENINANQEGFITTSGQVREINTTGSLQGETWADGDILYLSPTIAGAITNIKPTAPSHTVIVGYVEYAHAVHGKIYVKIDNGYELDELHNVLISTPLNNQALVYETATTLWKNKTIIQDSITNGVTDVAPSQNAVFDALALKQDLVDNFAMNRVSSGSIQTLINYSSTVTATAFSTTATNSNNQSRFIPFVTDIPISFDEVYIFIATGNAGASANMTFYVFDDSNNGLPGVIQHQQQTANGSLNVTNGFLTFTTNFTLQPGVYWFAFHVRGLDTAGTNPTFHFASGGYNAKSIEFAAVTFGNNYQYSIRGTASASDLTNNPSLLTENNTTLRFPMIKFKTV